MNSRIWMVLGLVTVMAFCGCTRHYVVTMTNGSKLTVCGKPKLQNGSYVVKDAAGKSYLVPSGRVREIAPASMEPESKGRFNPSTGK